MSGNRAGHDWHPVSEPAEYSRGDDEHTTTAAEAASTWGGRMRSCGRAERARTCASLTSVRSGRGFTVIVLSYDRPRSLRSLLRGLAAQRLDGLAMELIVCNNAAGVHLSASPWTATGRLLRG